MTSEKPYYYRAFNHITSELLAEAKGLQDLVIALADAAWKGPFTVKKYDFILADSTNPIVYGEEEDVVDEQFYEDVGALSATLAG